MTTLLPGHNVDISDTSLLVCPFCRTKICALDDESQEKSKEFMGKHLAYNHKQEMERVLKKLEKRESSGFKKGL